MMENEKNEEATNGENSATDSGNRTAPRARNRTVMLTPDITGEVRERLRLDLAGGEGSGAEQDESHEGPAGFEAAPSGSFLGVNQRPSSPFGQAFREEESTSSAAPSSTDSGSEQVQRGSFGGQFGGYQDIRESSASSAPSPDHGSHEGGHQPNSSSWITPSAKESTPVTPEPEQQVHVSAAAPRQAQQVSTSGDQMNWSERGKVLGFLVSYDEDEKGSYFPLQAGRMIITSEANGTGDHFLVADKSVSPMHAIIRVSGDGKIQVLDQLSENGTRIQREHEEDLELSGDKGELRQGDIVSFGERKYHVCLVQSW